MIIRQLFSLALLVGSPVASAESGTPYGLRLEGFDYPHPTSELRWTAQGESHAMVYMDVAADTAQAPVVVLLHGKNYCAATWESAITALHEAGYRVIAPDQIGFCKSSKPAHYAYSLHQLAANTQALLSHLKVTRATIVGHSMGGMLAARYALMYPDAVDRLVLVNPIGLEDWKAEGVPWRSVDDWLKRELRTDAASIKAYQQEVYFGGKWKPDYDRWVGMLAGMYAGDGRQQVAWNQALTSDMVFTQPVVHEFARIAVPTTLLIGQHDRTAIGRDLAPPALRSVLGNYPELGKRAARIIPRATLVAFDDLGHSPQVEAPARFNAALLKALQPAR